MVLTPLRESHSARGNQRIYAPKGTPEAISPGGPLQAHRGGMRLTRRPLSRGWGTFLGPRGGWTGCRACSEPRSDPLGHASTAWVGPPSPCVPCSERTQESDCRWRALPKPWIITIPGRRPVPPRPRGFREPPACGCSPAMQSGRRPPQTTGGNREPGGRYQGSNGNSAPRAALPHPAAGASALPRGTLAVRPPIWRCSRDTEPTPAGRLGAAAFPPGSGPPLGQKCDLPLRATVVELLHPPWQGVCPARAL